MWEVIDALIEEVKETNLDGNSFDVLGSVIAQIPFFTCPNHFYNKAINRDIERYSYCTDNGVAPYKGTYGEQPASWVDKFFAIKHAFAKKETMMYKKISSQNKG